MKRERSIMRWLCGVVLGLGVAQMPARGAGPGDEDVVVVKAGHVITGTGEDIAGGEIVIIDGKVRLVGRKLEYPKSAKIIDAHDLTVMPGMIHAHTRAGLANLQGRSGVHGDLKASAEVELSELDLEDFLRAGFTAVCLYPNGSGIAGVSSLYRTAGEPEERLVPVSGYLHTSMNSLPRDKQTVRDAIKKAKEEIERVEKARTDWEAKKKEADAKKKAEAEKQAGEPAKEVKPEGPPAPLPPQPPPPSPQPSPPKPAPPGPPSPAPVPAPAPGGGGPEAKHPTAEEMGDFKPPEMDPAHRPIVDLIQKKNSAAPLLLVVGKATDVLHAADALSGAENGAAGIRHEYLINPSAQGDFNYVVETLGKEKALVLAAPMMHRMPQTIERYNLIGELFSAGAEVAVIPVSDAPSDLEAMRARTADLVRAGVQRVEAIRALTINPAKAVGADTRLGSIEKGKDADLVFLDGDPLDPAARVKRVMILGKIVWEAAR